MTDVTIEVLYSCAGCGLQRVSAAVPARTTENVVDWLEKVAARVLSADHQRRSPLCRSTVMSEVMIPISGADRVGGASSN